MGVDITAICVLLVRVCLNCESLISFLDSFCVDTRQCFWSSEQGIEVNTCDMGEDMRRTVTEVKIALPVSHNTLTRVEEYVK